MVARSCSRMELKSSIQQTPRSPKTRAPPSSIHSPLSFTAEHVRPALVINGLYGNDNIFHVSCFMFHVSCFMFHVSCFMFHVSCFMFHVSCFMFHVSCFIFHVSCLIFHVSCFMFHVSYFMFHVSYFMFHISCFIYLVVPRPVVITDRIATLLAKSNSWLFPVELSPTRRRWDWPRTEFFSEVRVETPPIRIKRRESLT